MKYKVFDERWMNEKNNLQEGVYDFEVIRAEEVISKRNLPSLKLTLKIYHFNEIYTINDYLPNMASWKIKYFMNSIGIGDLYQNGELTPEDCLGSLGRAKILQEFSEHYGIKSVVSAYLPKLGEK